MDSNRVEIRPKWDWKQFWGICRCTSPGRWNQTKVGLKVLPFMTAMSLTIDVEIRPKWDWKTSSESSSSRKQAKLKSDQSGIERLLQSLQAQESRQSWNQTKVGLKALLTDIECFNDIRSWNQTKVGLKVLYLFLRWAFDRALKSDQSGIESLTGKRYCKLSDIGWNQTKVGLKEADIGLVESKIVEVEIRPKWDWKSRTTTGDYSEEEELKSDQSGIER